MVCARAIRLLSGLTLFALGTVIIIRADLGPLPWDVLHVAVAGRLGIPLGPVVALTGLATAGVASALGAPVGRWTVVNAIAGGALIQGWFATGLFADVDRLAVLTRMLVVGVGVGVLALGVAIYLAAGLGSGPRDALMIAVAGTGGLGWGCARAAVEGGAAVAGVALGGRFGAGTVLGVALVGPALAWALRMTNDLRLDLN